MLFSDARYTIAVGNYGSGKTELSIALARARRKQISGRIALVDLDIVNPYFRSAEHAELLKAEGIEVFMPTFAMSTVDIPALPAQIQSVFTTAYDAVFIDVGGDDTGAAALGRYYPQLSPLGAALQTLYVVNPLRPLSGTADDIVTMFQLIQNRIRIHPDLLVNNANLQNQTTVQDLLDAQALLEDVSVRLSLPIGMVAGEERLRTMLPQNMQERYFSFSPLMKPEWLEDEA